MQSQSESPFASVMGLGPLISEHRRRGGKWVNAVMGGLLVLAAPVLCLLAAYLAYDAYTTFGINRIFREAWIPLACGSGALLLGALVLWEGWRSWGLAAALYEQGLAYANRNEVKQVRWDDIEGVWQQVTKHYTNGVYTGTTHVYTIVTREKARMVLDDKLDKVEDLGNQIQKAVLVAQFPRYWQALQTGQRLTFGPLALDGKGLYAGKKELTWQEIKGVKISQGIISVKKEKGWFNWATVTVPQVPNFYIFLELVSRFTKLE